MFAHSGDIRNRGHLVWQKGIGEEPDFMVGLAVVYTVSFADADVGRGGYYAFEFGQQAEAIGARLG